MISPEPMTLGSPASSPTTTNTHQYLPSYLLGGDMQFRSSSQTHQMNRSKLWSGGGGASPPRSTSIARSFTISSYDNKYHNHQQQHSESFLINSSQLDRTHDVGRPSGPPLNRLMDSINKHPSSQQALNYMDTKPRFNDFGERSQMQQHSHSQDISFTPTHNRQHTLSPPSPTQIDPFYTQGESIQCDDMLDETWVTIFGFPSSANSFVLQEFSIYGQIIKHIPSTQGNWMHVQYMTKFHAQKALSKNGKIIANNIMIGVMPCIDKKIMQQSEQQENVMKKPTLLKETNKDLLPPSALPTNKIERSMSLRSSVRPLSNYNRNDSSDANLSRLPKKNTNVISKAMEYMFGW